MTDETERRGVCTVAGVPEAILSDANVPSYQQIHGEVLPQLGSCRRRRSQVGGCEGERVGGWS